MRVSHSILQDTLRFAFERAVTRRMMSDVPWGVLLSGGLDSSLVAAICARNINRRSASFPKLHSFTVGLEGSPDLIAAKKVADFLGTIHHPYTYTLQEGSDAIRDVIRSIETYDLTTIRASTPMYLMSRKIKAMGIKMVISGEGADEVFGGYLYFHKAPNAEEFFDETVDKLSRLHMYDCLRCNKSMSAWGVEPRVPFLDADFLEVAMNLDPNEKMIRKGPGISKQDTRIEKWAIRKAFDTPDDPYLPDEILWRQKEQFSDGRLTVWKGTCPKVVCELTTSCFVISQVSDTAGWTISKILLTKKFRIKCLPMLPIVFHTTLLQQKRVTVIVRSLRNSSLARQRRRRCQAENPLLALPNVPWNGTKVLVNARILVGVLLASTMPRMTRHLQDTTVLLEKASRLQKNKRLRHDSLSVAMISSREIIEIVLNKCYC
jgi:hypothetical protein